MTVHVLSAGDGYAYYTREVASADELRQPGRELGDYYTVHGMPPGLWAGAGITNLGLSGEVTEEQMRHLFGEGRHPDNERITAELVTRGATKKEISDATKLGRAYYQYKAKDRTLLATFREAEGDFERLNHRQPTEAERRRIRAKQGAIAFRIAKGRPPQHTEELGKFITAQTRPQQNPVAGFDLVFSPAKSVSVLWALGDEHTREAIEKAHEEAITSTIKYLEREAIATRTGTNGVAQEDVKGGIIAARFRHYDSRDGDPQLHDHLVVANKVQLASGKWLSIDSALLHRQGVAASEAYNMAVMNNVQRALGVTTTARQVRDGKRPVMEIAGIDPTLTENFSKRSVSMRQVMKELSKTYEQDHGRTPPAKARIALAQQANLATREAKKKARSLAELRTEWKKEALRTAPRHTVRSLLTNAQKIALQRRKAELKNPEAERSVDIQSAAKAVVEEVSTHHAAWGAHMLEAEARRWVQNHRPGHIVPDEVVQRITRAAIVDESIALTPASVHGAFQPLTRRDGSSIYEHKGRSLYTSEALLRAEDRLIAAGRTPVIPAATGANFEAVALAHDGPLDAGQRNLALQFATSDKLLLVGTGPAGAGKTTALKMTARTVENAGGRVVALATSGGAADVLGRELGTEAHTMALFLKRHEQGPPRNQEFAVGPGDVIVVDEAGMAGTKSLARVLDIAENYGAAVRLIGDDKQLSAVEAGGALRRLESEVGSVQLEDVHRFQDPKEAAASLALRTPAPGEADPFGYYLDNGRITGGSTEQMIDNLYGHWQESANAGKETVMIAHQNASVAELNARAQAHRLGTGETGGKTTVRLRDGLDAYNGDIVVSRRPESRLKLNGGRDQVKNNDRWMVTDVHSNGSLSVESLTHGGTIRLPADYVKQHVEIGYASTVHRAQGQTADVSLIMADASTTRENAYVGLTRGREENHMFVATEHGQDVTDVLSTIAGNNTSMLSAHDAAEMESARVDSLAALMAQYQDAATRADELRVAAVARTTLADQAEQFIASPAWGAVAAAIRHGEETGWDPSRLLAASHRERNYAGADDVGAVLSARIESRIERGRELADRMTANGKARPLENLTDAQLDSLLATATARKESAAAELAQQPAQETAPPAPPWHERRFGRLSDDDLSRRLTNAREQLRKTRQTDESPEDGRQADKDRKTHWLINQLKAENDTRQLLPTQQRARETIERGPVTLPRRHPSADENGPTHELKGMKERMFQAKTVEARITAEQRNRDLMPSGHDLTESVRPDGLPEWIAPARPAVDELVPASWREHLIERRRELGRLLQERGAAVGAERPEWSQQLGDVPANPRLKNDWLRLAAEIEAFRARYQVDPAEPAPIPAELALADIGKELTARTTAIRKSAKLSTGGNEPTEQSTERHQRLEAERAANAPRSQAAERIEQMRRERQQAEEQRKRELQQRRQGRTEPQQRRRGPQL
ncbi:MobF family relaxase [Arthrobacter monumenti]